MSSLMMTILLLAQNATEKSMTYIGIALFGGFMFFLILDSLIKGKYVPKKKNVRSFLIFLFIASVIAIILMFIYYK